MAQVTHNQRPAHTPLAQSPSNNCKTKTEVHNFLILSCAQLDFWENKSYLDQVGSGDQQAGLSHILHMSEAVQATTLICGELISLG